jgi:hypothetical protein
MKQLLIAAALAFLAVASPTAQSVPVAPQEKPAASPPQQEDKLTTPAPDDRAVNPSQPDFTIIGLPTTLKIPRFASAFRVTHRFTRSLGSGDFADLAREAFGFDGGAQIGLEYRFGIMAGTQLGIHRTSDRTIQFFGQYHLIDQTKSLLGVDVVAAVEGTNNFRDSYSPSLGVVLSRELGRHGALYAHPIWINNTNKLPAGFGDDDNDTFIVGLGARLRVRPTVYVVGEAAPRFGYTPDAMYASFAIEKRAGGHSFQLNFSNGIGTTFGQLARGGLGSDTWYIGFNITRKFF